MFALSHDDLLRIAHAAAVHWDNLLPSDLWPPLGFWVVRLAWMVFPSVQATPAGVNLVASTVALGLAGVLTRRIGGGVRAACATVVVLAVLPWWTWLGCSALAEPLSTALVLAGIAASLVHLAPETEAAGRDRAVLGAALAYALAGMVRYEAWAAAALHAMTCLAPVRRALGATSLPRPIALAALGIPLVFPIAWMTLETVWNGNPLFFATMARENLVGDPGVAATPWHAPLDVLRAGGVVAVVGLVAAWRGRKDASPAVRALAWAGMLGLGLQIVAQLGALAGTHNTPRHHVGWMPILAVLAVRAAAASLATLPRGAQRGAIALSVPLLLAPWLAATDVPDAVPPEVARMAARVRTVRAGGTLGNARRVMLEAAPWECFALQIALAEDHADLSDIRWDRDPFVALGASETLADRMEHPSLLAAPPDEVAADLRDDGVGLLVTATPRGRELAGRVGIASGSAGDWTLWRVGQLER
ncbi:MAG: hypothetical protein RLZZ299_2202 [Pseudomonadota bacterium]